MKSQQIIGSPMKNFTPVAAGLILAGFAMLAMPTVTAAGIIYAGVAAIVLSNLSLSGPLTVLAFAVGAVLVDNLVADIGTNLVALPDITLPSVQVNR